MLQRYIVPPKRIPRKLRVQWKRTENSKFYVVRNTETIPYRKIQRYSLIEANHSKYIHNLSKFPYAGQVFRTSFNCFLPEKSGIQKPVSIVNNRSQASKEYEQDQFIATFNNPNLTISEMPIIEEVNLIVEEFIRTVTSNSKSFDNRGLSDLLLDFVQDENEKWYLIKCKAYKIDYIPSKDSTGSIHSSLLLKQNILSTELVKEFYINIKDKKYTTRGRSLLSPETLTQRLDKIEKQSKFLHSKQPLLYIDMADVISDKINYYESNNPGLQLPSIPRNKTSLDHIDKIAAQYDKFRKNSRSSLEKELNSP